MVRHYHIITCDNEKVLNKFVSTRAVGIRPVLMKRIRDRMKRIRNSVRMNWDILADLARVKKGDYILLHAKGIIQGVFEVKEEPRLERRYTPLFNGPSINVTNWQSNWQTIQNILQQKRCIWWIPIEPVEDLFFNKMSMDIIFESIASGRIVSLPQRLRYEDKNKTIKGLTNADFEEIVGCFYNYSSPLPVPAQLKTFSMQNFSSLDLNYLTQDRYEKNLEALIVHRIRVGNMCIKDLDFFHSNVLNTVPLGYLKMADLLTWSERGNKVVNPWIWELKRDKIKENELKEEIKKLSARASYLQKLLPNGYKVNGIVLAYKFEEDAIDMFNHIITPIGPLKEVMLVNYDGVGGDTSFSLVARR